MYFLNKVLFSLQGGYFVKYIALLKGFHLFSQSL